MTGSGKTGLVTAMVEEALRAQCRCSSSAVLDACVLVGRYLSLFAAKW